MFACACSFFTWSSLSAVLFTVLAGLFALFAIRFTAVFSGRNNVSVFHSPRFCSFCYFYIPIFLRRNLYTFLLFYCFLVSTHAVCIHTLCTTHFISSTNKHVGYNKSSFEFGLCCCYYRSRDLYAYCSFTAA